MRLGSSSIFNCPLKCVNVLWFVQYFYVQCFYGLFNVIVIIFDILFLASTVGLSLSLSLSLPLRETTHTHLLVSTLI